MRDETGSFSSTTRRFRQDKNGPFGWAKWSYDWQTPGEGLELGFQVAGVDHVMNIIVQGLYIWKASHPLATQVSIVFVWGVRTTPKLTPIATSHNRKSRHLRVDVSGLRSKGTKSR